MSSLIDFWERANVGRDLWDNKKEEELSKGSLNLIKLGLEINPDKNFWDDFISIFSSNSEDAASLLSVSPDIVASWSGKIKKGVEEVEKENNVGNKRSNMANTGLVSKNS